MGPSPGKNPVVCDGSTNTLPKFSQSPPEPGLASMQSQVAAVDRVVDPELDRVVARRYARRDIERVPILD